MHTHVYGASAQRGNKTYRYCTVRDCRRVLFYYGNDTKPEVQHDKEYDYYVFLAQRYEV